MQIADLAQNNTVSNVYLLFRVDTVTDRIITLVAHTDTEVDPLVLQNLEEVAHHLKKSVYHCRTASVTV